MEALKKMQAGADKLATVVGVTIGPKVGINVSYAPSLRTISWPTSEGAGTQAWPGQRFSHGAHMHVDMCGSVGLAGTAGQAASLICLDA